MTTTESAARTPGQVFAAAYREMQSLSGPMKVKPASLQRSTKALFSARNP